MTEFIVHSTHAESLHDGRMVAPGSTVELSPEEQEHDHNALLLEHGILAEPSDEELEAQVEAETHEEEEPDEEPDELSLHPHEED